MTQPLLSVLIPTVRGREIQFGSLLIKIQSYYREDKWYRTERNELIEINCWGHSWSDDCPIEIRYLKDDKSMTIGEKRELLYREAKGLFSWQIDDDDDMSDNAIELILEAIRSNLDVDCITFEEYIDIDGKIQRSNHSLKYDDWANNQDGYDYVRTPFMKSVIKTEIARSVPIPHIRFGEDHQWAQRLKLVLKTEIHIPQQIYRYIHRSSNHNERYGIKD